MNYWQIYDILKNEIIFHSEYLDNETLEHLWFHLDHAEQALVLEVIVNDVIKYKKDFLMSDEMLLYLIDVLKLKEWTFEKLVEEFYPSVLKYLEEKKEKK